MERPPYDLFSQSILGKALAFFDPSGQDLMGKRLLISLILRDSRGKYFAPTNGKTPICTVLNEQFFSMQHSYLQGCLDKLRFFRGKSFH